MNNSTLRILAVVSLIVLLFGGMSVFLALQVKSLKEERQQLQEKVTTLETELNNCQ